MVSAFLNLMSTEHQFSARGVKFFVSVDHLCGEQNLEPGLSQGFSRHLASRHLNLSRYTSHVLLCRTQANSSHFKKIFA